jgi:hypothetical protein
MIEANVEAMLSAKKTAREACIEAMGNAVTARICRANDENILVSHKELAESAPDAAIASDYVVVADDLKAKEVSPS